ncbi:hypothetical protein ABKN59_007091 [Abortiporus biennis]
MDIMSPNSLCANTLIVTSGPSIKVLFLRFIQFRWHDLAVPRSNPTNLTNWLHIVFSVSTDRNVCLENICDRSVDCRRTGDISTMSIHRKNSHHCATI